MYTVKDILNSTINKISYVRTRKFAIKEVQVEKNHDKRTIFNSMSK